jgi:uncharacterized protein
MWYVLVHFQEAHMKTVSWAVAFLCWLVAASITSGQGVSVSRENKTVAVTVTESLEVQPEIGVVSLGYHNFGRTQSGAYEENGRVAGKIIEALLKAGVKKEDIQTETLQLGRSDEGFKQAAEKQDLEQQFQAQQTWKVRAPIGEVQKVVDQAVAAGANDVEQVEWMVKDQSALDGRARALAIAKARGVAEEMVHSLGGKVGALLYVSNTDASAYLARFTNANASGPGNLATLEVDAAPKMVLNLFPQKVRRDATVYAIFALE